MSVELNSGGGWAPIFKNNRACFWTGVELLLQTMGFGSPHRTHSKSMIWDPHSDRLFLSAPIWSAALWGTFLQWTVRLRSLLFKHISHTKKQVYSSLLVKIGTNFIHITSSLTSHFKPPCYSSKPFFLSFQRANCIFSHCMAYLHLSCIWLLSKSHVSV